MLVFADANLVMFAVPKTGTTALHLALRSKADIVFSGKAALKHMTVRKYDRHFAPYLKEAHGLEPERAAVIRHPVEQLKSWYRYRLRPSARGKQSALVGMSFDDFVAAVIADRSPEFAKVGSQLTFVSSGNGALRVEHLFAYERPVVFRQFLEARLGREVVTKPKNVSPPADAVLSPDMEAQLRAARAGEFALYERIIAAGGHLHSALEDDVAKVGKTG